MQIFAQKAIRVVSKLKLKFFVFIVTALLVTNIQSLVNPSRVLAITPPPSVSIGDVSVVEGDSGIRNVNFVVALSRPATSAVSIQYVLTGVWGFTNSGKCGIADADFNAKNSVTQTLNFPLISGVATATYKHISVQVCGDTEVENDETFTATLSNATGGYTIIRSIATGTIIDDDSSPSVTPKVSVGDVQLQEGDSGNRLAKFVITLSKPSPTTVLVNYKVNSGSGPAAATCGSFSGGVPNSPSSDCWNNNGKTKTVTFSPGTVQKPVTVTVASDEIREYDETFHLNLISIPSANASFGKSTGVGQIYNDDNACNNGQAAPAQYDSVVVVALENRTWSNVGMSFSDMPYLFQLAQSCSYYASWSQADINQSSMTQYGAQVTGALQPNLVNNCNPSLACSTTADNIFRQARVAGKTAINYVEGATAGCAAAESPSTTLSWVEWVPAMYMWGADDQQNCNNQVRPYSEFDPNNLPNFAFISPNSCNNGHDVYTCGNDVYVDNWARDNVEKIIQSSAYKDGKVAVFIWYDEYDPVPNMQVAPTAKPGPHATTGVGYASTLKAWQSMLGLPCLENACAATDMRISGGF